MPDFKNTIIFFVRCKINPKIILKKGARFQKYNSLFC